MADSEDRSEEPTGRRLQKAREEGESARSIEVPAAAVTLSVIAMLHFNGASVMAAIETLFGSGFVFDLRSVESIHMLPARFADHIGSAFWIILPLLLATVITAIVASGLTGGYLFSLKAASPKLDKFDIIAGIQRMFSTKAIAELTKALVKFALVGAALVWVIDKHLTDIVLLETMSLEPALLKAGTMLTHSAFVLVAVLALIAVADAFYQRHQFHERMKMSKQEVRDEMKDAEGRPEVKQQIRRRQREIATRRMMERVKDADVVITNPEHFAVALAYDPSSDGAPILLAKGVDEVAARIREEAEKAGIHRFAAPPLARALYFTTKIDQPIPETLYQAVAQVIAYVFNLNSFQPGKGSPQKPTVSVPAAMLFDTNGKQIVSEERA
jgi:flagellar biosynthetic protein FlhB